MGLIKVLCENGDIKVEWDPDDQQSVDRAKAEWKRLKEDGYEFFEVVETKGKRVERFSKKLGQVFAAPGVKTAEERKSGARPRAMAGGPVASPAEELVTVIDADEFEAAHFDPEWLDFCLRADAYVRQVS